MSERAGAVVAASAPGKVLWAGEYAILDGAPAVVCAVDRRATARLAPGARRLSPFLAAARQEIAAHFGAASPEAEAAARVIVDSSALEQHGRKLGLGSSAAATVAAVTAAIGANPPAAPPARELIHRLAHRAHGAAQAPRGARGSGADIAASVHGGLLRVERAPGADDLTPLRVTALPYPPDLAFALIWTGQPADTASLVARVRAFRDANPHAHAAAIQRLGDASATLAAALAPPSEPETKRPTPRTSLVDAVETAAAALAALATATGAPLIPPSFAAIQILARQHRGAAKPTGAGGGDLVLAVFPTPDDAAAFRQGANAGGMTVIQTSVDLQGVRL